MAVFPMASETLVRGQGVLVISLILPSSWRKKKQNSFLKENTLDTEMLRLQAFCVYLPKFRRCRSVFLEIISY
jgi:hypothetical protein